MVLASVRRNLLSEIQEELLEYFVGKPGIKEDRGGKDSSLIKLVYGSEIPIYFKSESELNGLYFEAPITEADEIKLNSIESAVQQYAGISVKVREFQPVLMSPVKRICLESLVTSKESVDKFYDAIVLASLYA